MTILFFLNYIIIHDMAECIAKTFGQVMNFFRAIGSF